MNNVTTKFKMKVVHLISYEIDMIPLPTLSEIQVPFLCVSEAQAGL